MIQHLGIVLDGNRRFAARLLKKPWIGHLYGLQKAREALEWTCQYGIGHVTAYVLSLENFTARPRREIKFILKYLEGEADNILNDASHIVNKYGVKVNFIGRIHLLPEKLQKKLLEVERATKNHKNHVLNLAIAYGGQQEIVDAVKSIVKKIMGGILNPNELDDNIVKNHLYTNGQPVPDLIIRTGGRQRISNFLLYQSAYSELVFMKKLWPELTRRDFFRALRDFEGRQRKFGS